MAAATDPAVEIRQLAKDLGKFPAELRKALRPALKAAAEPIATDARGRASWSTRIPRAISVGVRVQRRDPAVYLRVRSSVAPHGRPLEGIRGNETFRHPLFGRRGKGEWMVQATRPYLAPALEAATESTVLKVAETVDAVARELGFR